MVIDSMGLEFNILLPSVVGLPRIDMEVSWLSRNAEPPIEVTELGMVTEVSWLSRNA